MEIRIYAEGGGDGKESRAQIRAGFHSFLRDLIQVARDKGFRFNIVPCGPRNAAFEAFKNSLHANPGAVNLLLVDSEGELQGTPWRHLELRDGWPPIGISDDRCHLMVQAMESWLIADRTALAHFYGPNFNPNQIPGNQNVEEIDRHILLVGLKHATRNTTKGEYQKVRHASQLLALLDVNAVRGRAPNCERLFSTLQNVLVS